MHRKRTYLILAAIVLALVAAARFIPIDSYTFTVHGFEMCGDLTTKVKKLRLIKQETLSQVRQDDSPHRSYLCSSSTKYELYVL